MPAYNKETAFVKLQVEVTKGQFETWYSMKRDDAKGMSKSVEALKRRILNNRHKSNFFNYTIYDNQTGEIIEGQTNMFSKDQSVYKLVIYQIDNTKQVFYSLIGETEPTQLINEHLNPNCKTALLFSNPNAGYNGDLLAKWNKGQRVL